MIVEVDSFQIYYEITMDIEGPTLLLIPPFGEQIGSAAYPKEQCQCFADHGFRVVRMENRDSGLSAPSISKQQLRQYSLLDLADDVAAVVKHLKLKSVHLIGSSIGGVIARWAAIRHPQMVQTLTVAMSSSGASMGDPGPQTPKTSIDELLGFLERRPREEHVKWNLALWRRWLWGKGYPFPKDWLKKRIEFSYDRAYRPEGNTRLLRAAQLTPSLWEAQRQITCPTLVIHGGMDPAFPEEHGQATASQISNAELWLDPLMGHVMHREQWKEIAQRVSVLAGIREKQ